MNGDPLRTFKGIGATADQHERATIAAEKRGCTALLIELSR
jgi:hypothetical protein